MLARLDRLPMPQQTLVKAASVLGMQLRGVNLHGWLVLQPWVTPSLFYQFLGADVRHGPNILNIKKHTAMDQKTFCTALGPAEANKQLRRHWAAWRRATRAAKRRSGAAPAASPTCVGAARRRATRAAAATGTPPASSPAHSTPAVLRFHPAEKRNSSPY